MDKTLFIFKRLKDVLVAIEEIEFYLSERPKRFDVFCKDRMFRSAVLYNISVIGEAIGRILKDDPSIKKTSARQIVNTRNYVIHGYDSLDNEILWGIVINHLPTLKDEVQELLASADGQ